MVTSLQAMNWVTEVTGNGGSSLSVKKSDNPSGLTSCSWTLTQAFEGNFQTMWLPVKH